MSGLTISMVNCATDTETRDVRVEKVWEAICTGGTKLKGQITQIRNRFEAELATTGDRKKAKLAVDALKKQLPGVTPSGRFKERKAEALIKYSGVVQADLDSLGEQLVEVREKLKQSPHVFALFLSPTCDGLKAWFRAPADPAKHLESFRAVEKHVKELTGVQIDQSCKDIARLCFMSYDPHLYVNDNAVEITPLPEPEKPKATSPNGAVNLPERQRIATELLGDIEWQSETSGYVICLGKHLHTTGDGERDCKIDFDHVPTVHCFHDHCRGILADINRELRSRIGKAEYVNPDVVENAESNRDEEAVARLAALPVLDYERCRKDEADKLGCREAVLDRLVESRRPKNRENNGLQGNAVQLPDVEPWPEHVNGAELLNEIAEVFNRYIVLPDRAADVCSLWCALTHVFDLFLCSPRLNVRSAEPECGKTTLRDVVSLFVPRPVLTENLTVAVLFRLVNAHKPVLLVDEYDAWMRDNEEMRGLLNAGHRRGSMVYRCEGDGNELRAFSAYAPVMLCGIGALPGTLHDRSIVIHLERKKDGEVCLSFDPETPERERDLCRKLARWCVDNRERFAAAKPKLPAGVFNRLADNWRPLFVIAEVAGGDWPKRCADACARLIRRDYEDAESIRVLLLTDIRKILAGEWPLLSEGVDPIPVEKVFSKTLVGQLCTMTDRPWPEARRGKPISEQWLAKQLANFRIHPKTLRIEEERAKGYESGQFINAFARYLPLEGDSNRDVVTYEGKSVFRPVTRNENVTATKIVCTEGNVTCHASKGRMSENGGTTESDIETVLTNVDPVAPIIGDEFGIGRL